MRTNTNHFARRMLETLIEEGLTPEKAEIVRDEILKTAELKGWPMASSRARAKVSKFSPEMQSVYVDDDGLAVLHTGIPREHQPIIAIKNFGPPPKRMIRIQTQIVRR